MSHLRLVLTLCLVLALLAPGASQSLAQPVASPAPPAPLRAPQAPGDEHWAAGFNYPGANGIVLALAVGPDGSLYAGGYINTAGGVTAYGVARWDGVQWHPLGSGTGGVYALAIGPDGSLYAGGKFTTAGGVTVNGIARWDAATSSWHPLAGGMAGTNRGVGALAVGPDGSLYAGGAFTAAGGVAANNIARWDGAQWHPLDDGIGGFYPGVGALAVGANGSLYAGGSFATAGGVAANNIARWDGSQWHPLGTGTDHSVFALAAGRDGSLYAGGSFTSAGDQVSSNIAQWNGDALRRYLPLIQHQ